MNEDLFAASRLTVARHRRGLTKKALAELVGVSGAAMTKYENGSLTPSEDTAQRLAIELDVSLGFFYGDEIELVHADTSSFRSLRSMPAPIRDRVLATGDIGKSLISPYLLHRFELPECQVPDLPSEDIEPAMAAAAVRDDWALGQAPIANILHLVESKGVHVYWVSEQSLRMDAFSFWHDGRPYIVLRSERCGERQRMNVAHELGHLVLHRDLMVREREREKEAFSFAGSLLLPEAAFREYLRRPTSMGDLFQELFRAKVHWGISAAAVLRRCRETGLIDESQYNRGCREISVRKWRRAEPNPLLCEESLLHEKVFAALKDQGVAPSDMARELNISVADLLELMPAGRRFEDSELDTPEGFGGLRLLP